MKYANIEDYLSIQEIISETEIDRLKVEFNLLKEEKSFSEFLLERSLITKEQFHEINELRLIEPEKIKIRVFKSTPQKDKGKPAAPVVSEQVIDTQKILVELFEHYEILEVAGRGAMSFVYKIQEKETGEIRALKMLKYAEFADDDQIKRFTREAKVVGSLRHPNIIKLYDFGSAMGMPYYTMDYIEGSTLEDYLPKGPVTQGKILDLMEKVIRAVHAAHVEGIIHRDLKPSNIMIDANGEPLLVDFGIAKFMGWEASNLTRTGETLGTPAYMSPEQAMGRFTDHRSDIFSLGTILYECLTHFNPFIGETAIVTFTNIVGTDPEPPSKLSPGIGPALDSIIMKCLKKDATERYETAEALADDIAKYRLGKTPVTTKLKTGFSKRFRRFRRKYAKLIRVVTAVLVIAVLLIAAREGVIQASRYLASADMKGKKYEKALGEYHVMVTLAPGRRSYFIERAVCYRMLGKYQKALEDLGKIPESDKKLYPVALMHRGYVYMLMKKNDRALECLTLSLEGSTQKDLVYLLMARVYISKGDSAQAHKMVAKALSANPGNREAQALDEALAKGQKR
ncbi:MAG: protein kinase [Candidatus Eremiobacteraeota bacterium]|nr:protein kinase [Candidatus Eremiobacteraeota bacterium]